jgi:3-methyladenine DNA glycosylase AlkC
MDMKKKTLTPFKEWLNAEAAKKIAVALHRAHPNFKSDLFLKGIDDQLRPLELKARMQLLKDRVTPLLPADPRITMSLLTEALKENDKDTIGLSGFLVWPLTHYVAEEGIRHRTIALQSLYKMTQVFTGEFAVRPFLINEETETLKQLLKWTEDENEHVRRWTSEGTRPILPWGQKLPRFLEDPSLTWPILEGLKDDSSKYVQKSVANHMNDFSKKHGDWLVKELKGWPNPWVARHAVRTLVKKGHPGALKIVGGDTIRPEIKKLDLKTKKLKLGQALHGEITFKNTTKKSLNVIVDVEVDFLKANGKHSVKVFKGKKISIASGQSASLELKTPIKKVTTRSYHYGEQYWSLLVNGGRTKKIKFLLTR